MVDAGLQGILPRAGLPRGHVTENGFPEKTVASRAQRRVRFLSCVGAASLLVAASTLASACTRYLGSCLQDDVHVRADADLERLRGVRCLAGSLMVMSNATVAAVELPELEHVRQSIVAGGTSSLESLRLPRLQYAYSGIGLTHNASLHSFDAPALTTIAGAVTISSNPELESVSAPALETVGVGGIWLARNPRMRSVDLPSLVSVGGPTSGTFFLGDCDAVESLSAPSLVSVADSFGCEGNATLRDIRLPALALVGGSLSMKDNPSLSSCLVAELIDRLFANGFEGKATNVRNHAWPACPSGSRRAPMASSDAGPESATP